MDIMSSVDPPTPPPELRATEQDLQTLREMVDRLKWHEMLFRVASLLYADYTNTTSTRKGAMKAAYQMLEFVLPGCCWLDTELVIHRPEEKPAAEPQAECSTP
jgi:hypothetical protein